MKRKSPKYTAGDLVFWDEEETRHDPLELKSRYGQGPFIVAQVNDVDTTCNCAVKPNGAQAAHGKECRIHARERAGHPQFVQLVGFGSWFSGAWFRPASQLPTNNK